MQRRDFNNEFDEQLILRCRAVVKRLAPSLQLFYHSLKMLIIVSTL